MEINRETLLKKENQFELSGVCEEIIEKLF
jgi:hypothetical protein